MIDLAMLRAKIFAYKEKFYILAVYLITFLFLIFPYSDKDWGWHLKYGEYFLRTGKILMDNVFTWTLPNYHWINHEWLFDPLLAILYKQIGFSGLSILGALVSLISFWVVIKKFKLQFWKIAILSIFFIRLFEVTIMEGLRSQVLAILFLSALIFILMKIKDNINFIVLLPILFWAWANFHGTFIVGIIVAVAFLGSYWINSFWKERKLDRTFFIYLTAGLISISLTFANPFGYKVYLEDAKHFSSPYLKYIYEWQPISPSCTYCHEYTFFAYAGAITYVIYKRRNRFLNDIHYIALFIVFGVLAFDMQRYLGIFVVITLPYLATYLETWKFNIYRYKSIDYLALFGAFFLVSYNLFNRLPLFNFYNFTEASYCNFGSGCSLALTDYLIKNPPKGKGFNFYDWGGYLIGKGVDVKLFIDGRMHLWSDKDYMPFAEYYSMYYMEDYKKFEDYRFDWAIVRNDSLLSKYLLSAKSLGWKLEFQEGEALYFIRSSI